MTGTDPANSYGVQLPVSFMHMRTAFLSIPTKARTLVPCLGPRVPSYISETLEEVRVSPDSQSTAPQGALPSSTSVWFLRFLWALIFICSLCPGSGEAYQFIVVYSRVEVPFLCCLVHYSSKQIQRAPGGEFWEHDFSIRILS